MSQCDIQIEFYRPDRVFRTGDKVQGWARVNVDRNVRCRGLNLLARWGTHGRGNPTRKNYHQETLFQGQWVAGEQYEYAFEFQPPPDPLTYHGHYLNIDHYVSVRADIPWAIDPRAEEEFLWLPGSVVPDKITTAPGDSNVVGRLAGGLMIAISIFFLIVTSVFLIQGNWLGILLLFVPPVIIFFGFRQKIAERRLGNVQWETPATICPAETINTQVSIGPGGRASIREVSLRLAGCESVISGSGSSQSTYRHDLVSQRFVLAHDPSHHPHEVLQLEQEMIFPNVEAWSIDLPDNQVTWSLRLQIKLGWWPDWNQTRTIRLVPAPVESGNDNPAFHPESIRQLIDLTDQLSAHGTDLESINRLIAANAERLFEVQLTVSEVVATDGQVEDPAYAAGRTVLGILAGSDNVVSIRATTQQNEQVDKLAVDQSWNCTGVVTGWNLRRQRVEILAF